MRLPSFKRAPGAGPSAAATFTADMAALSGGAALEFPRADGPSLPDPTDAALSESAVPESATSPSNVAPIRVSPVAVRLMGLLLAMTLWSLLTAYYFNYQGVKNALETQSRDAVERSGVALENALLLNAANLQSVVQATRHDAVLVREFGRELSRSVPVGRAALPTSAVSTPTSAQLIKERLEALRAPSGADRLLVLDLNGRVLGSSASAEFQALPAPQSAELEQVLRGQTVLSWVGTGAQARIRAMGPMQAATPGAEVVGALVAEFFASRAFLRNSVSISDVNVTVMAAQGPVAYTSPEESQRIDPLEVMSLAKRGTPMHVRLSGKNPVRVHPVRIGQTPLVLVLHEPQHWTEKPLLFASQRMFLFGLLTVIAAVLLGLLMTRWLIRPIQALTARAEELSVRHAGRAVSREGSEFDRMLNAFNAMTDALLAHSERLKKAHLNELQNSLELQRQYALMRLLRGLATVANESDTVEQALRRALEEIGEYLDWPIGRVALLPQDVHPDSRPPESFWFTRDRVRFSALIAQSEGRPIVRTSNDLLGRAYASGLPHWVSDLARLTDWSRRDQALAAGLKSGVVIPVTAHGHVTAFIEFFSDHRVEATAEMLELIEAIGVELSRVAERHRAEGELRASEAEARRTALVAASTANLVTVCDAQGHIEWVNNSFLRVTGYPRSEVIGARAVELLRGPQTDTDVIEAIERAIESGAPIKNVELVQYAKNGEPYWVEVEMQPVFKAGGILTNFVVIENDITQRKLDERRLGESALHFKALFEDSPVPAAIQGTDGRWVRVNRALARMLGTTPENLIGRNPDDFTPPEERAAARQQQQWFEREVRDNEPFEYERRYVGADGAAVWAQVRCVRLAPKGVEPYVIAVLENVTDVKAKERALREAKDAAEAASRAKSQFLANMSHEIRTPMNGVLGMTELLLGTVLSDRQKRFAQAVYRSGEALLGIINDILDLSKIEAGRFELERTSYCIRTLIEDVFEMLAVRAHQKHIEIAYRVNANVPGALQGDPLRLRQILTNLVGNAIKFTEHGEVVLDVEVVKDDRGDSGDGLRFTVRDTGIGMTPEAVSRLFGVFMQADESMSRRYGGTGLGLAISKHLVELMGGHIRADSRVGEGSTFIVEVPLVVGDETLIEGATCSLHARDRLMGRRVLIVDDNPAHRNIAEEHLQAEGMDCARAPSASSALNMLRTAAAADMPFDVLVIDLKSADDEGAALVCDMRADARIAKAPIVVLTALAAGPEAEGARPEGAGVLLHLAKPVRQHQLIQSMVNLLAPAQNAAPVAATTSNAAQLAGTRVLLVEDNAVNQELAHAMLQELGCVVTVVHDGVQALRVLARQRFDVVLMDCQMPEMDGYEAVRRFRAGPIEAHPEATPSDAPVVALTANVLQGDDELCRQAGFSDYLGKPFRQEQLVQVILRNLHNTPKVLRATADTRGPADAPALTLTSEFAPKSPADPIDLRAIEHILGMEQRGATGLLARLIETYLETSVTLMAELHQALDRGDAARARHAAHTLKSTSAHLGATALAALYGKTERHARDQHMSEAAAAWSDLEQTHAQVTERLRELAARYAPAHLH